MLWYKAWLETRARFLISLVGMAALCSFFVYRSNQNALPYTPLSYYNNVLHRGHVTLTTMWVLAVTLLMMGGMLRERAVGASTFSLSLPVSRTRLMAVRIGTGVAEAAALAIGPWSAMLLTSVLNGKSHPLDQACYHILFLFAGGLVFLAIAFFISSVVEGEYTAPAVSLGVMIAFNIVMVESGLNAYDPYALLSGAQYFHAGVLTGPFPWLRVSITVAIAALLTAIAIRSIQRKDF
jgi:ABC-2 type transport system permease protein